MTELVKKFYEIFNEYYEKYQQQVVKSNEPRKIKILTASRLARSFYSKIKDMFMDDVHFRVFKYNRPLRTVTDYLLVNNNYLVLRGRVVRGFPHNVYAVNYCLLIGEDSDSGKLFCNILPNTFDFERLYKFDDEDMRESYIRYVLGFNYHYYEIENRKISELENKVIRIQGDVTMCILKTYNTLEELIKQEYSKFVNKVIEYFTDQIISYILNLHGNEIIVKTPDNKFVKIEFVYFDNYYKNGNIYLDARVRRLIQLDTNMKKIAELNIERDINLVKGYLLGKEDGEHLRKYFKPNELELIELYKRIFKKKLFKRYVAKALGNIVKLANNVIIRRERNSVIDYHVELKGVAKNIMNKVTRCINYDTIYNTIASAFKRQEYIRYIIHINDHKIYVVMPNNLTIYINNSLNTNAFRTEFGKYILEDAINNVLRDITYQYRFTSLIITNTVRVYLVPNQVITIEHDQHGERDIYIDKWCLVEFNVLNRHWFDARLREAFTRNRNQGR